MSQPQQHSVVIVGAGLAGLVASFELVKMGVSVRLYESTGHIGGKACSYSQSPAYNSKGELDKSLTIPKGVESDHGYHVFPHWYTNMRQLWTEIGVQPADVYDGKVYMDLFAAENGQRKTFIKEPSPTLKQVLSICDLVIAQDEFLHNTTLEGFLHSRDYHHPENPLSLTDMILNALTIGDEDISALSVRNVFRQWLPVFGQPNWGALRGSLDEILIRRLHHAIVKAADSTGAQFELSLNHHLVDLVVTDDMAAQITIEGPRDCFVVSDLPIILAIPQEVLRAFNNGSLYERLPEISKLHRLRSNPFSAIDIFFSGKLPDMTQEHFTLTGSPYGLTGFDISLHWPELIKSNKTVLQFVAANSVEFRGLDGAAFVQVMAREIARFFPEVPAQVEMYIPHMNMDVPLFVTDVGTERFRPDHISSAKNLVFAGDFVKHDTDVTSMEGAVRSGRNAAEALRQQLLPAAPPVNIQPVTPLPPALQHIIALAKTDPVEARLLCMGWFSRIMATAQAH